MPHLGVVMEMDEMPGAFPNEATPDVETPTKIIKHVADAVAGRTRARTPKCTTTHHNNTKSQEESLIGKDEFVLASETSTCTTDINTNREPFQFSFRAQSQDLSAEAQRMMAEKREEIERIKKNMIRIEEEEQTDGSENNYGRKIAHPKGRYSDVHQAQFKKMDSIASHVSASRVGTNDDARIILDLTQTKTDLKRSSSKAELDKMERGADNQSIDSPREESSKPAKRIKFTDLKAELFPSKPNSTLATSAGQMFSNRSLTSTTPTKIPTTFGRSVTVKVNKTSKIASSLHTPKSASRVKTVSHLGHGYMSHSPTKNAYMLAKHEESAVADKSSPLLSKSPFRPATVSNLDFTHSRQTPSKMNMSLLTQSPIRYPKLPTDDAEKKVIDVHSGEKTPTKSATELYPSLIPASASKSQTDVTSRFKMLRKSPIKSILREPQRLYSDDPLKIANGTHLATPPGGPKVAPITPSARISRGVHLTVPFTAPVHKQVDFSASTKLNDDHPKPLSKSIIEPSIFINQNSSTLNISYPELTTSNSVTTKCDLKQRRQTLGPFVRQTDFTFDATGGKPIRFGPSPTAVAFGTFSPHQTPTIRHVSADPPARSTPTSSPSRKRKFEDDVENKENEPTLANLMIRDEADEPRFKKLKVDSNPPSVAEVKKTIPSFAQGTAAQKAKANMTRVQMESKKKKNLFVKSHKMAISNNNSNNNKEEEKGDGKGSEREKEKGKEKPVLTRAKLDFLSQPKKRVDLH